MKTQHIEMERCKTNAEAQRQMNEVKRLKSGVSVKSRNSTPEYPDSEGNDTGTKPSSALTSANCDIGADESNSIDTISAKDITFDTIRTDNALETTQTITSNSPSSTVRGILEDTIASIDSETENGWSRRKDVSFCRICHEMGTRQQFISPCLCKGSLYLVHKECLERWLAASDSSECELCGFYFKTNRLPKYSLMSSVYAWITCNTNERQRKVLLWDVFTLIILFPLMALCSLLGMRVANNVLAPEMQIKMTEAVITRILQMFLLSGVLLLDMGVLSWTAIRVQYHFQHWYCWYRRNCKVVLLGYPEADNTNAVPSEIYTPQPYSSTASVHVISF